MCELGETGVMRLGKRVEFFSLEIDGWSGVQLKVDFLRIAEIE